MLAVPFRHNVPSNSHSTYDPPLFVDQQQKVQDIVGNISGYAMSRLCCCVPIQDLPLSRHFW